MTRQNGPMRLAALASGSLVGLLAARRVVRSIGAWPLDGRVALVTGGTRGLGLLIARELLAAGCRVAICGRDGRRVDAAVAELGGSPNLRGIPCDVGNQAQVHQLVDEVKTELGPIDLLVTNAATINVGGVGTMDAEHFERAMRDTFFGALHPILAVLPAMRERGEGRICIIGSIGGRVAFPHLLPYAASKYALTGLSEGLRAELAADGITVTTIVPGFMRTGSFLASDFHEPATEEYGWFALGASLPILTLSPRWAARRIVRAIRHGEGDVTLGWFARLGGTVKSVTPGLTADVLGLVDRWVLPRRNRAGRSARHRSGVDVHRDAPAAIRHVADRIVERSVETLNQPPPR